MNRTTLPVPGDAVTADALAVPPGVTPARLALGRAGSGLPTAAALAFSLDHAEARDAVHAPLDAAALAAALAPLAPEVLVLDSAAPDRATYLRRPDFGRRLSRTARETLAARSAMPCDVAVVVGDGLSARAVAENALPVLEALVPALRAAGRSLGPIAVVRQARVAVGDEVGAALGARLALVLIGERPGLSAADSLGAYLTFAPAIGRTDAERNCVSNIRAAGLTPPRAAATIAWLIAEALGRGLTGVSLKDESGVAALTAAPVAPTLPGPAPPA